MAPGDISFVTVIVQDDGRHDAYAAVERFEDDAILAEYIYDNSNNGQDLKATDTAGSNNNAGQDDDNIASLVGITYPQEFDGASISRVVISNKDTGQKVNEYDYTTIDSSDFDEPDENIHSTIDVLESDYPDDAPEITFAGNTYGGQDSGGSNGGSNGGDGGGNGDGGGSNGENNIPKLSLASQNYPNTAIPGETTTGTAVISNSGGSAGDVIVNRTQMQEKTITVPAGSEKSVKHEFELTSQQIDLRLDLDSSSTSFSITRHHSVKARNAAFIESKGKSVFVGGDGQPIEYSIDISAADLSSEQIESDNLTVFRRIGTGTIKSDDFSDKDILTYSNLDRITVEASDDVAWVFDGTHESTSSSFSYSALPGNQAAARLGLSLTDAETQVQAPLGAMLGNVLTRIKYNVK